jgi:hypothetical protein
VTAEKSGTIKNVKLPSSQQSNALVMGKNIPTFHFQTSPAPQAKVKAILSPEEKAFLDILASIFVNHLTHATSDRIRPDFQQGPE